MQIKSSPSISATIDNVCVPNGLKMPVKVFTYPSYGVPIHFRNLLKRRLAFSCLFEGQFEGMDILFTLLVVLLCVLNKNTACLWTLGEILFATGDNGRHVSANISAVVLLANFLSPYLHNQRNV